MVIEIALDDINVKSEKVGSENLTKNKKSSLDDIKKAYEKSDVRKETKQEVADFETKLSKETDLDTTQKEKKYKKFLDWFFDSDDDIVHTVDETWQSGIKIEVDWETFEAHIDWKEITEDIIDYKIDKITEEIKINETVQDELNIEKWKIVVPKTKPKNENESTWEVASSTTTEKWTWWEKVKWKFKDFKEDLDFTKFRNGVKWVWRELTDKLAWVWTGVIWARASMTKIFWKKDPTNEAEVEVKKWWLIATITWIKDKVMDYFKDDDVVATPASTTTASTDVATTTDKTATTTPTEPPVA